MNDIFSMAGSLAAGFGAGVLFFGGLWLTVRHLDTMRHPALVILLSFVTRLVLALGVIWWFCRDGFLQLALCMAGFLVARFVLIRSVQAGAPTKPTQPSEETESCT